MEKPLIEKDQSMGDEEDSNIGTAPKWGSHAPVLPVFIVANPADFV